MTHQKKLHLFVFIVVYLPHAIQAHDHKISSLTYLSMLLACATAATVTCYEQSDDTKKIATLSIIAAMAEKPLEHLLRRIF